MSGIQPTGSPALIPKRPQSVKPDEPRVTVQTKPRDDSPKRDYGRYASRRDDSRNRHRNVDRRRSMSRDKQRRSRSRSHHRRERDHPHHDDRKSRHYRKDATDAGSSSAIRRSKESSYVLVTDVEARVDLGRIERFLRDRCNDVSEVRQVDEFTFEVEFDHPSGASRAFSLSSSLVEDKLGRNARIRDLPPPIVVEVRNAPRDWSARDYEVKLLLDYRHDYSEIDFEGSTALVHFRYRRRAELAVKSIEGRRFGRAFISARILEKKSKFWELSGIWRTGDQFASGNPQGFFIRIEKDTREGIRGIDRIRIIKESEHGDIKIRLRNDVKMDDLKDIHINERRPNIKLITESEFNQ